MKSALCLLLMFCVFVRPSTAQLGQGQTDEPAANPARPTVSNPATLTPVGYLQFETGVLGATDSPEFSTRSEWNEVIKLAVSRRLEFVESSEPLVHYNAEGITANGTAEVFLGAGGALAPLLSDSAAVAEQRTGCRPARQVLAFRDVHGVHWIRTEDGGVMRADSEILADLVKALSGTSPNGAHRTPETRTHEPRTHRDNWRPDDRAGTLHRSWRAPEGTSGMPGTRTTPARVLGIAQVHATLALAAATAVRRRGYRRPGMGRRSRDPAPPPRSRTRAAWLVRKV